LSLRDSRTLVNILELGVNDFVMLPLDPTLLATRLSLIETRLRELDEMRSLQTEIKQEYQRFLIATGGLGDGVWDFDLATETVHFSDRWKEMLGYSSQEIEDNLESWLSRVHPEDLTRLRAIIDASIAGEVTVIEQRYRVLINSGDYRWMLTRGEVVKDSDGKAIRVVGRQTDVDQEDESREAVRTSGLQDPLTRLPNRAVLMDRLRHAFARANRDAEQRQRQPRSPARRSTSAGDRRAGRKCMPTRRHRGPVRRR
jgi:PAS domain S-box-containing protein